MPLGTQWEYAETVSHVAEALKDPTSETRQALDTIIAEGGSGDPGVIDGGTP